ncbi:recombinase-like helix-turn-helix domain-containing protein [Herbaspirillum autotrophicum]|uniref:recombinase-like helix-turn-helix domain-containing protein n=1 Tax=Herbaspirillum autotrophicum TaxID=180195 RepID=UPI00067C0350|nr:recombinase-like helix-turn-helix domain-containing protein [Herbaspirillum autotrophicum]
MSAASQEVYLNPHQARRRQPTQYEDLLGDTIERAYAAGIHDLPGLVAQLNRTGPSCPHNGGVWTEAVYQEEIARLAA